MRTLIEAVIGAWRERDGFGRLRSHPAWHDLEPGDRVLAFSETQVQRQLEAALDPAGLSSTAHAVLRRIREQG